MNLHPSSDSLLQAIGRLVGLPDLAWDDQASCTLSFGDDVHLTLYAEDDGANLTLYTLLGPLPSQAPAAVWRELLQANLFGKGTGGATLGYEANSECVYLSRLLPAEGLSAQQGLAEIQTFVHACRQWQARWPQLQTQSMLARADDPHSSSESVAMARAAEAPTPTEVRSGLRSDLLRA